MTSHDSPVGRPGDAPTSDVMRAALELTEVEAQVFDRAFEATTGWVPWPKAYGGDMVAQASLAAMRTVEGKHLHSTHSYFLRPVDIGAAVRYEVELLRDGRGYAQRQVRGFQNGKPVFVSLASFAAGGEGPEFSAAAPDVPAPEGLPSAAQYLAEQGGELPQQVAQYWAGGRSIDMRHVPGPLYVRVEGEKVPHQGVWLKTFDSLGDDDALHRAVLAYACDYTIIEPTLRVLDTAWSEEGLVTASLDHSMWFHRPFRADEWLLYAQESVSAHEQRGLGLGRFFDTAGRLVATVAQEALIRKATS